MKRIQVYPFSSGDRAQIVTRKGGNRRAPIKESIDINNVEVLQGEMIHGNAMHLLKECDIFLGAWQSVYFKVCLSVALIFQEV